MMRFLAFINHLFGSVGALFQSPLLLLLRVFFGIGFILAGFGKLKDIAQFSDFLLTLHIPSPEIMAPLVAFTEIFFGSLLVMGFLSRIAVIPLIITMIVAYATAHVESIRVLFTDPKVFISQPPFNFLLTCLLVFAFGPGTFSLDALMRYKSKKDEKKALK